ncbi:MAG: 50S ribosomal protein L4 [Chlamydiales bacterium]|nr:50S ribosomal protein L4 [Chlamydiales bacterium]
MTSLKKYDLSGKQLGEVAVDKAFMDVAANSQMIKDYIVALRANARQWSANTKGRSEVNHSTQKPHRQKGLGRSRQGSLAAPQYKGGGRVFGPKPKFDQHVKINKKERRLAMRYLLAEKIQGDRVHVLKSTELAAPKTKTVHDFLEALKIKGRRVLFLGEGAYETIETEGKVNKVSVYSDRHAHFVKSVRNLPKVEFALVPNANGYDLMLAHDIIITEEAWKELHSWIN